MKRNLCVSVIVMDKSNPNPGFNVKSVRNTKRIEDALRKTSWANIEKAISMKKERGYNGPFLILTIATESRTYSLVEAKALIAKQKKRLGKNHKKQGYYKGAT